MYQSFTIGRKIVSKENTDTKLNTEIENAVMGVCMRKPKADLCISKPKGDATPKNKALSLHFTPKYEVFGSTCMQGRSDAYYAKFARETLENDIEKELK
jgi:hypothetical protein